MIDAIPKILLQTPVFLRLGNLKFYEYSSTLEGGEKREEAEEE